MARHSVNDAIEMLHLTGHIAQRVEDGIQVVILYDDGTYYRGLITADENDTVDISSWKGFGIQPRMVRWISNRTTE